MADDAAEGIENETDATGANGEAIEAGERVVVFLSVAAQVGGPLGELLAGSGGFGARGAKRHRATGGAD